MKKKTAARKKAWAELTEGERASFKRMLDDQVAEGTLQVAGVDPKGNKLYQRANRWLTCRSRLAGVAPQKRIQAAVRAPTRRERAICARDAVLSLVGNRWKREVYGSVETLAFDGDGLKACYRTPFQRQPAMSDRIRYVAAREGWDLCPLPYQLEVWFSGQKVLNIEWADDGRVIVVGYKPGEWEDKVAQARLSTEGSA